MKYVFLLIVFLSSTANASFRYYNKYATETLTKPVVIMTFDDQTDNQYTTVRPILNANGFKATFFIAGQYVVKGVSRHGAGTMKSMSVSQLRDLQNDGHDISSHGFTHAGTTFFKDWPKDSVRKELNNNKLFLRGHGFFADEFMAWPGGSFADSTIGFVDTIVFCGRGASKVTGHAPGNLPNWDRYRDSIVYMDYTVPSGTNVRYINDMAHGDPKVYIMLFHSVSDSYVGAGNIGVSYFDSVVTSLKSKSDSGLIDIKSMSQFFASYVNVELPDSVAKIGDTIGIKGYGFHKTPINVTINGTAVTPIYSNPESLAVIINNVSSGYVKVTNADGNSDSTMLYIQSFNDSLSYFDITINSSAIQETDQNYIFTCDISKYLDSANWVKNFRKAKNIRAYNPSNNIDYYRIIKYDSTKKSLLIYTNVPKSTTSNTIIRVETAKMYSYKNSSNVFTASRAKNAYMFDDPQESTTRIFDEAGGKHGVPLINTPKCDSTGKIGFAFYNSSSSNIGNQKGFTTDRKDEVIGHNRTLEFVLKPLLVSGVTWSILTNRDTISSVRGSSVYTFSNSYRQLGSSTRTGGYFFAHYVLTNNTWAHCVMAISNSGIGNIYVNGVLGGTENQTVVGDTNTTVGDYMLAPFRPAIGDYNFNGWFDYMILYDTIKTTGYVLDRYNNVFNPSLFYTTGSVISSVISIAGSAVVDTLKLVCSALNAITYQWYQNDTIKVGATDSVLTIYADSLFYSQKQVFYCLINGTTKSQEWRFGFISAANRWLGYRINWIKSAFKSAWK